jgi:hypothetical protein
MIANHQEGVSMKNIMLFAVCTFAIAACGPLEEEDGSTATASQAILGWTPWVSEEQPAGTSCGTDNAAATYAGCSGSYCDSMRLFCGTLPSGFVRTGTTSWTGYISEEAPNVASCPAGYIIDGIRATGSYGDNVSVRCVSATFPSQGTLCQWTPWFSEEQGTQAFDVSSQSYAKAVALSVRCSGSYCDSMSYFVCEPKCTTHADCFSACVNGVCTVG